MATVADITEREKLARKLAASEEHSKMQMEWFLGILHVEPQLLKEFIDSGQKELNHIEKLFRMEDETDDYISILKNTYRSIHMIKGNASLLDLKFFARKAHEYEDLLDVLLKKEDLNSRDFIPLVMNLRDLRNSIEEINNMIERISQIHTHFRPKRSFENQILVNSIKNLIANLSEDFNKKVKFVYNRFKGEDLPYEYRLLIKDILIQLVRNSMTHGIENKEERQRNEKSLTASIEISTSLKNGDFCLIYKDDGRGLNLKKLRDAAENTGKWDKTEIKKWNQEQFAEIIYESGISTSDNTDLNAGRGVGMGAIRHNIKKHNGDIFINFEEGQFLEFIITLPLIKDKKKSKSYKIAN
jgi:chemotaxis protein histidine kinase CheA